MKLYHGSNVSIETIDLFQELMTKMCCIKAPWPEGWAIRRES